LIEAPPPDPSGGAYSAPQTPQLDLGRGMGKRKGRASDGKEMIEGEAKEGERRRRGMEF